MNKIIDYLFGSGGYIIPIVCKGGMVIIIIYLTYQLILKIF